MYWMALPDGATLDRFIDRMKRAGIHCVTHYQPLNRSVMGRRLGGEQSCPEAERAAATLVRLPFYNTLTRPDQERVIEEALAFFETG